MTTPRTVTKPADLVQMGDVVVRTHRDEEPTQHIVVAKRDEGGHTRIQFAGDQPDLVLAYYLKVRVVDVEVDR